MVAVIFSRLPLPPTSAAGRLQAAIWGDLQDGVRHVAADPVLAVLVVLAAAPALFVLPYLTFLPVYARDILAIGIAVADEELSFGFSVFSFRPLSFEMVRGNHGS